MSTLHRESAQQQPPRSSAWKRFRNGYVASSAARKIQLIREGADAEVLVEAASGLRISREQIYRIAGMSPATAKRRIQQGGKLDATITERLARVGEIELKAEEVFGSADAAHTWLQADNPALGCSPLAMMDTEIGRQEVERLLAAIAFGMAA